MDLSTKNCSTTTTTILHIYIYIGKSAINGDYGNGLARKRALKKAGYNPDEVQARVNELM